MSGSLHGAVQVHVADDSENNEPDKEEPDRGFDDEYSPESQERTRRTTCRVRVDLVRLFFSKLVSATHGRTKKENEERRRKRDLGNEKK
jgi:hypothetical protein